MVLPDEDLRHVSSLPVAHDGEQSSIPITPMRLEADPTRDEDYEPIPRGAGRSVEAGPELRVVNRSFAQSFFGVDPINAAASGRPAYRAGGGLERAGAVASAEYRLADRWALRGVERAQLGDTAARSPLVRDGGARQQVYAGIFLVWRSW